MRCTGPLLLSMLLACEAPPVEKAADSSGPAPRVAPEATPSSPNPPPVKIETPEPTAQTPTQSIKDAPADAAAPIPQPGDPPSSLPGENAGEWQRFFLDGCWESLAETKHKALATCDRIKKGPENAVRERCTCDEALIIEVRSSDPIFAWTSRDCWNAFFAKTIEKALALCTRKSTDYTREHCPCEPEKFMAVRGPYARSTKAQVAGSDFVYLSQTGQWLDHTGDWPCFAAGTLIETSVGPRPIEEVELGDLVRAYDVDAEAVVWSRVRRVKHRRTPTTTQFTMADGSTLTTTPNHPFFTPLDAQWRHAEHLHEGDILLDSKGRQRRIVATNTREEEVTVYNLSTQAPHNYFAGGVLVHNY